MIRSLVRGLCDSIVRGLVRSDDEATPAFSPLSLFASGEQGVWYDPSDLSSMFQDYGGLVPVTAVEQPVGLILDKRLSLALGAELATNGSFTTDTDWVKADPGITISGGTLNAAAVTAPTAAYQDMGIVSNKTYRVTMTVTVVAGGVSPLINGVPNIRVEQAGTSGTHSWTMPSGSSPNGNFSLDMVGFTGTVDNLSVKEIAGNHATQATAAARPVLSAPSYINYDGIDDLLATTFPDLGTDATIARAVPGVGASILTGQTIGAGVRNDSTDHAGLVIIDRALTAGETAALTAYLDEKAGV